MLITVEFTSFALDPGKNIPLIMLKEKKGSRVLSIPIGPIEASAIALETLKVTPDKPLTIDLAKSLLENLGGTLARVVFFDEAGSSLAARLEITTNRSVKMVECRPCDAIALALRCRAPMFARDTLFEKNKNESKRDILRASIASLTTLDFGNSFLE